MGGSSSKIPIYVDLDGTFIKSDMLFESFVAAVKKDFINLLRCILWLMQGRACLKHQLACCTDIDISLIPLNSEFYRFLEKERDDGRRLVLATAAAEKYGQQFYKQYRHLFDSVLTGNGPHNLKGRAKLKMIRDETDAFAYAGNSNIDFEIFREAQESYLVNPEPGTRIRAKNINGFTMFDLPANRLRSWVKQLRLHQWLKNGLIFVPFLVSGAFLDGNRLGASVVGFFAFSFLASATYIINDLADINSDRQHPRKKSRPLAAGSVGIPQALAATAVLFGGAGVLASMIGGWYCITLITYLGLTLCYSFCIKQYVVLDVIVLASLYTIRILAGAVIIGKVVSFWLLSFSMFIFFSLALVKRCAELKSLENRGMVETNGRDYGVRDYPVLMAFGCSSSLMSILLFCFYTQNNVLTNQYQDPSLLWLIIPALGYWLTRMWIKTHRGEMHDDPIVFSLTDRGSLITISVIIVLTLLAQIL